MKARNTNSRRRMTRPPGIASNARQTKKCSRPGRSSCLRLPGIHKPNSAAFKIGDIARRENSVAGANNGRDLRVELRDGPASRAPSRCDWGKRSCRLFIERQDAPGEILCEHCFSLGQQSIAALASGKKFDSVKNLRYSHGTSKEFSRLMPRPPFQHARRG